MKPTRDQVNFVLRRAMDSLVEKRQSHKSKLFKATQPDKALEAARAFYEGEKANITLLEHELKHRKEELKGKLEKLLNIQAGDTSYYGGYTEGVERVFDAYRRVLDGKITDEANKKYPEQLYKDFELEVVLSDSKELAKVLERFIKKL
jgi:hypothetical protein